MFPVGKLLQLVDEKWYVVDIFEDAYIGSRYFIRSYGGRECSEAKKFLEDVSKCICI